MSECYDMAGRSVLNVSGAVVGLLTRVGPEKGQLRESAGVITAKANCGLCANIRGSRVQGLSPKRT